MINQNQYDLAAFVHEQKGQLLSEEVYDAIAGQLNPDWVEWLMDWPKGWTSLDSMPVEVFKHWKKTQKTWWDIEPEIPRLAENITKCIDRLKAIGNGQVPACVNLAWEVLTP